MSAPASGEPVTGAPPSAGHETGTVLSLTALWVADLDRSVNFYVDACGFTEGARFPSRDFEAALVHAGAAGLELMIPTGDEGPQRREHGQMFNKIVLSVDDVAARLDAAVAHGGEIAMPATLVEQHGLVIGMARDPDGYQVEMTQRITQ